MSTLANALALAAKGIAVFPLGPNKKPLPGQWIAKHGATTDPDDIRNWHDRWPEAILCALTGDREDRGLGVVIDIDRKPDKDGLRTLADLEPTLGPLPPTLTCLTPSGGEHRHFLWPGGKIRNTDSELGPGIDTKGTNGSIVMPPSVGSRGRYAWVDLSLPIAALPEPWVVALRPKPRSPTPPPPIRGSATQYAYAALRGELARIASSVNGCRHTTVNRAAFVIGQLVGAGVLSHAEAESPLIAAAIAAELPEYEAIATVRDGLKDGIADPRKVPK